MAKSLNHLILVTPRPDRDRLALSQANQAVRRQRFASGLFYEHGVLAGSSRKSPLESVKTDTSKHPQASRDWHEVRVIFQGGNRGAMSLPEPAKGLSSDACGTE